MKKLNRTILFALLLSVTVYAVPASGALIVNIGNYNVTASTPVVAQISVSNSASASTSDIEGMTFTFQIAGGTGSAPKIMSVDLLTGTIWSGHVTAPDIFTPSGGNESQYQSRDILTDLPADFVNANGLLGTITIDTTGAIGGNYSLKLITTKTAGSDSTFLDGLGNAVPATFGQGTLIVIAPEPGYLTAIGMALLACQCRARRTAPGRVSTET